MNCYCCSGKDFTDCCAGYLQGQTLPSTSELLMRSRYSAYATVQVDYLIGTTHPSTRKQYDPNSIREWAKENQWLRLEIISTSAGSEQDKKGTVEFKAYYLDPDLRMNVHHELSQFEKLGNQWYFVKGKVF